MTLIDYPGKVACTVFLIGCNFRCPWCYSSELVLPEKIKKQLHPPQVFARQKFGRARISEEELFDFLKERRELLDGLVLCGGEPTFCRELPNFVKKIKKLGYLVKIDTNGSNPEMLKKLIDDNLLDYVAMDIKAPLGLKSQIPNSKLQTNLKLQIRKYQKATGVKTDIKKIKKSIEIIKNSGIDYEFRTTVVPGIHTKEDIVQIAKEISPAKRYFLQNFRSEKTIDHKLAKVKPYSQEYLLEIQKAISPFFELCRIR